MNLKFWMVASWALLLFLGLNALPACAQSAPPRAPMFGTPFAWSNSPTLFVLTTGNAIVTGNLFTVGQTVWLSNATKSALIDVYDYNSNLV